MSKRIIKLTESDLANIVKRVLIEDYSKIISKSDSLIKIILQKYDDYSTISGCGGKCQRKIAKETGIPVMIVGDVIDIYENNGLTMDLDLIKKELSKLFT